MSINEWMDEEFVMYTYVCIYLYIHIHTYTTEYNLTYIWDLRNKQINNPKNRLVVAWGKVWGKIGEGDQIYNCYKFTVIKWMSWGCNVQHGDHS